MASLEISFITIIFEKGRQCKLRESDIHHISPSIMNYSLCPALSSIMNCSMCPALSLHYCSLSSPFHLLWTVACVQPFPSIMNCCLCPALSVHYELLPVSSPFSPLWTAPFPKWKERTLSGRKLPRIRKYFCLSRVRQFFCLSHVRQSSCLSRVR